MIKVSTKHKVNKITIDDFSKFVVDNNLKVGCEKIYNFNNNHLLNNNIGIGSLMLPKGKDLSLGDLELGYKALNLDYFNKVMYFKQYFSSSGNTTHRLLIHGSNNRLYVNQMFSNTSMLNWTYSLEFSSIPIVLEYKKNGVDSILISSKDKLVVWTTNLVPYELTDVPYITSMCIYNDVLYCTIDGENEKIWYTTDLNPEGVGTETSSTKYITLGDERGACRKILTFKENVYIFRDYGISKLNDYAKDTPTYNQVYLSDSKIYANTVAVCGDVIMFMTKDGIYKFNGVSVSKVDCSIKHLITDINDYAVATNMQDKYYLALRLNFNDDKQVLCETEDDYKNNALIIIDIQDNSYQIVRGVDIKEMLALKAESLEKIVLTFNSKNKENIGEINNSGKYFNEVLPKCYETNYILQENSGITIRKVTVDASAGVVIKIITDNGFKAFTTYQNGINEFQTIIQCKKCKLDIQTNLDKPTISNIEIEYEGRE